MKNAIYEGYWKENKKNGRGRIILLNKEEKVEIYEGTFKDNVFEGEGTYIWADGEKYIG